VVPAEPSLAEAVLESLAEPSLADTVLLAEPSLTDAELPAELLVSDSELLAEPAGPSELEADIPSVGKASPAEDEPDDSEPPTEPAPVVADSPVGPGLHAMVKSPTISVIRFDMFTVM
jgi:hypothetical protein